MSLSVILPIFRAGFFVWVLTEGGYDFLSERKEEEQEMNWKRNKKWAAWLVLLAMLLNLLAPMTVWAGEEVDSLTQDSTVIAEQAGIDAEETLPEAGAAEETPTPEQTPPEADTPTSEEETTPEEIVPETPSAPEAPTVPEEEPSDAVKDSLLPETEMQQAMALKTPVETIEVTFSIETRTINGQDIVAAQNVALPKDATVYDALLDVAEANNVTVSGNESWINAINGITSNGDKYHEWSGWMFSINGSFAINTLIGETPLADRDIIRFVYCVNDDYVGRSDINFADLYVELKDLVEETQAISDTDYTEDQWQFLQDVLATAKQKLEEIDSFDAPNKADGLPGYILETPIALDTACGILMEQIQDLTNAIAKTSVYIPVKSITLEPSELVLYVGDSYQLKATVSPSYATDQQLQWEIAYNFNDALNTDVTNGLVKAEKPTTIPISVSVTCDDLKKNNITPPITKITVKEPEASSIPVDIKTAVNNTAGYLQKKRALNDWESFALARAGYKDTEYINKLESRIAAGELRYIGDYAKAIMTVEALGYDATRIGGNLVEKMYSFPWDSMYGVYGYSYVLIAADLVKDHWDETNCAWNREQLLQGILAEQDPATGAFSKDWISTDGTGIALQALSLYQEQAEVKKAIDHCLAWLQLIQKPTGGFAADDGSREENVNSTAEVLWALCALNIDPLQDEWVKGNGSNPYSALMSYANEDGSFSFGDSASEMATYQAFAALVALARITNGQTGIFDYADVGFLQLGIAIRHGEKFQSQSEIYTSPSLEKLSTVITQAKSLSSQCSPQEALDAANAIWQAIDELYKKVPAAGVVTNGVYDLEGKDSSFVLNEQSDDVAILVPDQGYLPKVMATQGNVVLEIPANVQASGVETIRLPVLLNVKDGEVEAALAELHQNVKSLEISQRVLVGAQDQSVNFDGDYVRLVFHNAADQEAAFIDHQRHAQIIKNVSSEENGRLQQLSEFTIVQNNDLVVFTKHFTEFVVYTVHTYGSGDDTAPKVTFSVDTKTVNDQYIISPMTVAIYSNDTPLSILIRQLGSDRVSIQNGSYVQSIDGYDDSRAECGWMYIVNGELLSSTPADKYILQDGDCIEWRYTHKNGADLDLKGESIAAGGAAVVPITAEERAAVAAAVQKGLAKVQQAALRSESLSAWQAFGLAAGGAKVPSGTYEALVSEVQAAKGSFRKVTDTEKMILAVTALGHGATQVGGYDLAAAIYDHPDLTRQGSNGLTFALLALDSAHYAVPKEARWTREKLVSTLLGEQNSDGGFALTKGSPSDVDLTAMALQALAPYRSQAEVSQGIDRALHYLSQAQREDGSFASRGVVNSESAAQVLLALTTLDIDPLTDGRFIKDKVTVLDHVLAYQKSDGTFSHLPGGESDELATEQGLLALTAMQQFLDGGHGIFAGFTVTSSKGSGFTDSRLISPWAAEVVQQTLDKGWLAGYADGSFRPQQSVTRAEFTALLLRSQGWPENAAQSAPFQDTADKWYAQSAAAAYERGLVRGTDGAFDGDSPITREEMAAMLCRVKGLAESAQPIMASDRNTVSPWAAGAVAAAYEKGLMVGDGQRIDPQGLVTREMAAATIWRLAERH